MCFCIGRRRFQWGWITIITGITYAEKMLPLTPPPKYAGDYSVNECVFSLASGSPDRRPAVYRYCRCGTGPAYYMYPSV